MKSEEAFVLILIVMEERIGLECSHTIQVARAVLILIVMEERIGSDVIVHHNNYKISES